MSLTRFPERLRKMVEEETKLPLTVVDIILHCVLCPPRDKRRFGYLYGELLRYECGDCFSVWFLPKDQHKLYPIACFPLSPCCGQPTQGYTAKEEDIKQHVDACTHCKGFSCRECVAVDFCDQTQRDDDICYFDRCFLCETLVCLHSASRRRTGGLVCNACVSFLKNRRNSLL